MHFMRKQPFDCANDTLDLQTKVDLNQLPKCIRMACLCCKKLRVAERKPHMTSTKGLPFQYG